MNTNIINELNKFGPSQIGIQVKNIENTSKLLSVLLGINSWRYEKWNSNDISNYENIIHYEKKLENWKCNLAFASLGNLEIELIENISGNSCYQEFETKKGYGIRHLLFKVTTDLQYYIDYFQSNNFYVSTSLNKNGKVIWAVIDTKDEIGFDIEIIQKKGRY